jgi:predicted dehydrogenase
MLPGPSIGGMALSTETVRWGVAATGGIAVRFMEGMQLVDDGVVAAVGSRTLDRAVAFADRFGIPGRHGSLDELAADPDLDVVYVASPHSAHEADTVRLLEAGKHVLCEKPLALNAGQAQRMADTARANGMFLMEAIWSRFLPAYQRLGELLAAGRIGTPLMVEASFGFTRPVTPEHRLFDLALGGGSLLDLGIYPVQLCSLVFGAPDRVAAVGHLGSTGVDERVAAVLHHRAGGLGIVQTAITAPLACEARISGSEGWVRLPAFMHCPQQLLVGGQRGDEVVDAPFEGDGIRFQVHEVHRCLREGLGESPVVPLAETVEMARTLDEVRRQIGLRYPGEQAGDVTPDPAG